MTASRATKTAQNLQLGCNDSLKLRHLKMSAETQLTVRSNRLLSNDYTCRHYVRGKHSTTANQIHLFTIKKEPAKQGRANYRLKLLILQRATQCLLYNAKYCRNRS